MLRCKIPCRTYVLSEAVRSLARVMRTREHKNIPVGQRLLGAVDLAIDFATLGEYGLEPLSGDTQNSVDGLCRTRRGHVKVAAWEAPATTRRRGCARPATPAGRIRAELAN